MKKLLNIICRIVGHKTFNESGYECCLRCSQHSYYNKLYSYTIPGLLNKIKSLISWYWDKYFSKRHGLPF